ncbi:MAG: M20/M25/M40 family metallo-hydrolase [Verrucomicrobiales bacterium]|nr:M20/M25/M40 family metallo-hydrolase [Verrucomicrobiales bacterium]
MHHQRFLSLFRKILSTPTAPFHEYHVAAAIKEYLDEMPHVSLQTDSYGNLIARYRRGKTTPHLAFAAHMDHPGWVKHRGKDVFLGGVPEERLDQHEVEWFGPFGMWKLTPFEIVNGLIHSRVCDDLIGCASIVALFRELEDKDVEADVFGLFTRAEEVGFNGAVSMAQNWSLPKGVRFVSLETSAPRGGAEIGKGPAIRVGDRSSVFDDAVTAELIDAATDAKIPHQRCLLDGGSCEATAMNLYGIPAAGISVLLGNYHNVPPETGIAEEYVSLDDAKNLVKMILATTERMANPDAVSSKAAMKTRLEKRISEHEKYFAAAAGYWEK